MTAAQVQSVRNLALLARQALSNGYETMSVDPRMIADAAIALDTLIPHSGSVEEPPAPQEDFRLLLQQAHEALRWTSGSADFCDGGLAHEGWNKVVRPVLTRLDALFPVQHLI